MDGVFAVLPAQVYVGGGGGANQRHAPVGITAGVYEVGNHIHYVWPQIIRPNAKGFVPGHRMVGHLLFARAKWEQLGTKKYWRQTSTMRKIQ